MPCVNNAFTSERVAHSFSRFGSPHADTEYLGYQHNRIKGIWHIRRIITTTE